MSKKKTSRTRKYPKLRGLARERASSYIAEEVRAGYPRRQAVAIGISRARAAARKSRTAKLIEKYLHPRAKSTRRKKKTP